MKLYVEHNKYKRFEKGKIEINDDAEWNLVCSALKKSLEQHLNYVKESIKSYEYIRDLKEKRFDLNDGQTLEHFIKQENKLKEMIKALDSEYELALK